MRIAAVNWCRNRAGGAESYLDALLPALGEQGHQLALWHEEEGPMDRGAIALPRGAPAWSAADAGTAAAISALAGWRPDVLFCHGLRHPATEAALIGVAPAVLFAHGYYGTCISGAKTYRFPTVRPCAATFGPACFLHHYLRRCGGLDPRTAWRDFRRQTARLALANRYRAVVTASEHMRSEYLRHGLAAERVHTVGLFVEPVAADPDEERDRGTAPASPVSLLFVGRLDPLKGVRVLLGALPRVVRRLGRPVRLDVAGDGPERERLTALASRLCRRHSEISVHLHGWLPESDTRRMMAAAGLLVVPSLWPEPFGLVGLEAGRLGLPAVAFAVGGIADWLADGINGVLAGADPPNAASLAAAIVDAVADPAALARLARGARERAARHDLATHLDALMPVLREAAADGPPRTTGR